MYNAAGNLLWKDTGMGGPIAVDRAGDVFVDTGSVLDKLNPANGQTVWSTNFAQSLGLSNTVISNLTVDGAGNVYLTGPFNESWVAKLQGTNGAVDWKWQASGGATGVVGCGVMQPLAVDGTGNVYVAGSFSGHREFRLRFESVHSDQLFCLRGRRVRRQTQYQRRFRVGRPNGNRRRN